MPETVEWWPMEMQLYTSPSATVAFDANLTYTTEQASLGGGADVAATLRDYNIAAEIAAAGWQHYYYTQTMSVIRTDQQDLRRQQRQERESRQVRARLQRLRDANARATALLVSLLDEANRELYDRDATIMVTGSAGGKYRINCLSFTANIHGLNGRTYCAHPNMVNGAGEPLPLADSLIAQMLMLQYDEPGFLRIANVS